MVMKTPTVAIGVGGSIVKASKPFVLRVWFEKVAKFVDDLVVKYYYKGERLRPEVWEEMQQSMKEAEEGRNMSPRFTNTKDAGEWLNS